MRVKLSRDAQQDIADQVAYLRGKTVAGIATFRDTLKRGQSLLKDRPDAGFTDSRIPIRGAKRIIVDGWYFDYDVIDGTVWIQRITSSVNTPLLSSDDNFDYETPSPGHDKPGGAED